MKRKGTETRKNDAERERSGFYHKYFQGHGLDIGCGPGNLPVLPSATGVDKNYPGYDERNLPFEDGSQDYVYNSHCLEHIEDSRHAIQEWMRVLRDYGYLIICVPHMYLYEKKKNLPSDFNRDHKRYYTPSSLLHEIEFALAPNTYRVRHLRDNDDGFDYRIPPHQHSNGSYEIECVIQKLPKPTWELA